MAISSDLTCKALRAPTVGAERLVGWELPFTSFKPVAALENAAGLIIGAPIVIPSMALQFTPGLIKASVTKIAPELLPVLETGLAKISLRSEDVIVRDVVSEFAKSHSGGSLDQGIDAMFSLAKNKGFQGDLD